jgi:ABC-type polysaccharide/polyol phosphate export permease
MSKFLWFLTSLAAIFAAFALVFGVAHANGAPQEASSAAIAVAIAVIPYVFARAWESMKD